MNRFRLGCKFAKSHSGRVVVPPVRPVQPPPPQAATVPMHHGLSQFLAALKERESEMAGKKSWMASGTLVRETLEEIRVESLMEEEREVAELQATLEEE